MHKSTLPRTRLFRILALHDSLVGASVCCLDTVIVWYKCSQDHTKTHAYTNSYLLVGIIPYAGVDLAVFTWLKDAYVKRVCHLHTNTLSHTHTTHTHTHTHTQSTCPSKCSHALKQQCLLPPSTPPTQLISPTTKNTTLTALKRCRIQQRSQVHLCY